MYQQIIAAEKVGAADSHPQRSVAVYCSVKGKNPKAFGPSPGPTSSRMRCHLYCRAQQWQGCLRLVCVLQGFFKAVDRDTLQRWRVTPGDMVEIVGGPIDPSQQWCREGKARLADGQVVNVEAYPPPPLFRVRPPWVLSCLLDVETNQFSFRPRCCKVYIDATVMHMFSTVKGEFQGITISTFSTPKGLERQSAIWVAVP